MRAETSPNGLESSPQQQKVLVVLGVVAAVIVVGLMVYFLRASDPAARGPIPYKKFDYGAHMQDQVKDFHRTDRNAGGASTTH